MTLITELPREILNCDIGKYLSSSDWGNLRQTCTQLRSVLPVDVGPVIYASDPLIGDQSHRYIRWRKLTAVEIDYKFNQLARPEEFILELMTNRVTKTLIN